MQDKGFGVQCRRELLVVGCWLPVNGFTVSPVGTRLPNSLGWLQPTVQDCLRDGDIPLAIEVLALVSALEPRAMRDNHQGYPELRNAYERDGNYFGVVRLALSNGTASFEFGVEKSGYTALKRILQARPFDTSVGASGYRYFFTGRAGRREPGEEPVIVGVRIEQGERAKTFDFDCPISLAANLLWFQSIADLSQAAALRRVPE